MTARTKEKIKIAVACFLIPIIACGQAPRPPQQKLSNLTGDVLLSSPTNGQVLQFVTGSGKWQNANEFGGALSNLSDVSLGALSANQLLQWNGSAWTNVAVFGGQLSSLGDVVVGSQTDKQTLSWDASTSKWIPRTLNAGTITPTINLLSGDGSGNAIDALTGADGPWSLTMGLTIVEPNIGSNVVEAVRVRNGLGGTAAKSLFELSNNIGTVLDLTLLSSNNTSPPAFLVAGDAWLSLTTANIGISTTGGGVVKFSNDNGTTERVRIGNGIAVGTTTDPGAGVVNAATGFRIGNAAGNGKVLQGNGTTAVLSTPTFPTTIGTAGQVPASDGLTGLVLSSDVQRDTELVACRSLGSVLLAMPITGGVQNITTKTSLVSGQVQFVPVYLPVAATITGVKFYMAVQGVFTADTSNVVAVYSYSGGTLTRQAISVDDANLWKATSSTWSSKAFSSTVNLQPGLYFIGFLYHTSAQTSAPALGAATPLFAGSVSTIDLTNSAKVFGFIAAQTTCPASQAMSGLTSDVNPFWVGLY